MAAPQYRGTYLTIRAAALAYMRPGQPCAEGCGKGIYPGQKLHLSHDHATGRIKGLSHASCNIAEGNRRRIRKATPSSGRPW